MNHDARPGAGARVVVRRDARRPGLLRWPFAAFGRYWGLTRELTRSEILGRYRGANFGLLWSLISPFLMLAVYTIAFGEILKSRWPQAPTNNAEFGMILFIGIIVHGFFAECLVRAPKLMLENTSYIKRVVFPLEILPWTMVLSALFHMVMNLVVFALLALLVYRHLPPQFALLPLVLLPLVLVTIAVSWFVSSIGVYVRDVAQVTPVIATSMFFLSSAIVPVGLVPERFRLVFELNPLTFFIDQARAVALWGQQPDWWGLLLFAIGGLVATYAAAAWFRRTSPGFADVL